MKRRILCEGLAVTVIILLFGVGIQSAIATIETENIDFEYISGFILKRNNIF